MVTTNKTLTNYIYELAGLVNDEELKSALIESVAASSDVINKVERFFALLPSYKWSKEELSQILSSWKATHLKMLAIYGLSCRLQRLAMATEDTATRAQLMLASSHNAETSYEDLGLDFGGETHAQLFHDLAHYLVGDFPWSLEKYCLPRASEFRGWIYQNMVVADIQTGLFTNMFSEIYNHAEYSVALGAFGNLIDQQYNLSPVEREKALQYVHVHVADETEVDHFLVVVKALNAYCEATQTPIDYELAQAQILQYLRGIGQVMEALLNLMEPQKNARELATVA
ncbi:MAG: hypothetical protein GDA44_03760 [Prochloron sp. SP5CPC1]|nr:hypothetical protein [Candidatus Paraprochloron terpiosi SP5CPC1]